jgi:hypothetical protein
MIFGEPRLAWGQQEAADKKLRRFRNYGLLLLCRTAAIAPVTLLPQAVRFCSL